jgi:hypothetical protein
MDAYGNKLEYLYKHQKYRCSICGNLMSFSQPLDLHHIMSQGKWQRRKFPLLIDSLLNLKLLHSSCHLSKVGGLRMSELEAKKKEAYLERNPRIAKWVNTLEIN